MGTKGKGKDAGNAKKPKAAKVGNRPHEERRREALKAASMEPLKKPGAERP